MMNNRAEKWSTLTRVAIMVPFVRREKGLNEREEHNRYIKTWKNTTEYWIRQLVNTEWEREHFSS